MDSMMSVSIIAFNGEDILFVRQCEKRQRDRLVLPMGRLNGGESLEECSRRIINEYAGIGIELDRNLGGVITRKNSMGDYIVTFIMLGETIGRGITPNAIFVRYGDIENYDGISEFSRFTINRLKDTSLSGIRRSSFTASNGREYVTYF